MSTHILPQAHLRRKIMMSKLSADFLLPILSLPPQAVKALKNNSNDIVNAIMVSGVCVMFTHN